jgi:hypothetical protein
VAGLAVHATLPTAAEAAPFTCPLAAGCDGTFDPGYDPSFTLFFTGSLYTIDADGGGIGDDGVVVFGDRAMTTLSGNPINPATSLRAFNVIGKNGTPDGETAAPIAGHDPFPSWNPDTPDADPDWAAAFSGSERYGFDFALGAGKALSPLDVALDWGVTLYPWAPGSGTGAVVQPYSGTVDSFLAAFAGDGLGGVVDTLTSTTHLVEGDGTWNIDFDDDGTDDEIIQLATSRFIEESLLYEVGNTFSIPNPFGVGPAEWVLNEWSTINPDTQVQGLNPLRPVPLPPALPLFATGVAVIGLIHWRRRRGSRIG